MRLVLERLDCEWGDSDKRLPKNFSCISVEACNQTTFHFNWMENNFLEFPSDESPGFQQLILQKYGIVKIKHMKTAFRWEIFDLTQSWS